jgi:hypothetical protein
MRYPPSQPPDAVKGRIAIFGVKNISYNPARFGTKIRQSHGRGAMFNRTSGSKESIGRYAVILLVACCAFSSHAKTDVPVFLLSGQSNMSGFTAISGLTADQNVTVSNVMIYTDLQCDQAKKKKWLTLGPGFGSSASMMGPELFFGKTLSDSMPGKKIAFIKYAQGSTYLGRASDWLPPSSNNGTGGTLYNSMMTAIDAAIKSIGTVFDTTQYTPRWAGFVWLQGEFDAYDRTLSDAYEKNLTNLISDIRAKVKVSDLPVIIPMIDAQNQWTYNTIVRAADVSVKQKGKNIDTLDTKGYSTDGTHYKAAGQVKIGMIAAQRWLNMHYNYGPGVAIAYQYIPFSNVQQQARVMPYSPGMLFDLSGKRIRILNASFENMPFGVFVITIPQPGAQKRGERITAGK